MSTTAEKFFDCGKVPWLWKSSLIVENFLDWEKVPWLRKSSLILEKLLECEKVPWLREKFLDCGKLTFLTAGKVIGLVILKTDANVETIET